MSHSNPIRALSILLAVAAGLNGCLGEKVAGTTTTGNTGKGTISGRVLSAKGEAVANAKVRVVSVNHNPGPGGSAGEVADVVLTAADGTFRTDSLADGLYNLLDEKDGQLAYRDSVAVDGDTATKVAGDDVLKPAGALAGVVRLQPGHDSRTVFLILMGTTTFVLPKDSIGNFSLDNLAEGEYRLRLLTTLDAYKPLDTLIRILSGVQGNLSDTLRLAYQAPIGEIPVVKNAAIAYDSTKLSAVLSWGKQDPSKVSGYHVYRKHSDSAYARMNTAPLTDTFFLDDWKHGLKPYGRYEYAVTSVDSRGDESRKTEPVFLKVGVRYRVEPQFTSNCSPGACHFDTDSSGKAWIRQVSGTMIGVGTDRKTEKWVDPHSTEFGVLQIAVEPSGGAMYVMYQAPLRVGKIDAAGKALWIKPLPFERDVAFSLHLKGDSILVWGYEEKVMTYLDKSGKLVRQDTLMKKWANPNLMASIDFDPDFGFYLKDAGGIHFLDRDGNTVSDWNMENRGYLSDIVRDAAGRWFLSWNTGVLDVYSPAKVLQGSILATDYGYLKTVKGSVYMQAWVGHILYRITPGY